MTNSLFDKAVTNQIIARVQNLAVDSQPIWGEMTAAEMLLHCNICNRQIFEESRGSEKTSVQQYLLRILALYIAPHFKRGIKSEQRNITKGLIDGSRFEEQKEEFVNTLSRFPINDRPLTLTHPAFGNISTKQWGIAAYKHMDHHLRQFGV